MTHSSSVVTRRKIHTIHIISSSVNSRDHAFIFFFVSGVSGNNTECL